MLRASTPLWMQQQIGRDLRYYVPPSRAAIVAFVNAGLAKEPFRFCEFHIGMDGQVRHCNFSARGFDPRLHLRIRIFARALRVLTARGELPHDAEVDFVLSLLDVEWEDLEIPVVTFQRGKAAQRLVRVPMWEQLDASWSRKVEQLVLQHEHGLPYERKRGRQVFWRGTDSAVPVGEECAPSQVKDSSCRPGVLTAETARQFHRLRVVQLSQASPHRIDAKLSGVKPISVAAGMDRIYMRLGLLEPHAREWRLEDQLQRRYLLDLDGSSQSTRLYWALLSNSVVFKQATKNCNWYSDRLRSGVHLVSVRRDLADLAAQVARVRRRPREAAHIARRSSVFARTRLSHEDAMHYLGRVIASLARARE